MEGAPQAPSDESELIGIKSDDSIEVVAAKESDALGLKLAPHDSSQWGDPYYSGWPASDVKLTANLDPMFEEGDPREEQWFSFVGRECSYLLWDVPFAESGPRRAEEGRTRRSTCTDVLSEPGPRLRSGVIAERWRR